MVNKTQQKAYPLRLPEDIRKQIEAFAEQNKRSVNAEIAARLQHSISNDHPADAISNRMYSAFNTFGLMTNRRKVEGLANLILKIVQLHRIQDLRSHEIDFAEELANKALLELDEDAELLSRLFESKSSS